MADDKTIVSAAGAGSETLKATEEALTDYHTTNLKRRMRCVTFFVIMAIAFVIITIININSGNVHISVGEIAKAIFLHQGTEKTMDIIWTIRLPRIITKNVYCLAKTIVASEAPSSRRSGSRKTARTAEKAIAAAMHA